MKSIVIKNTQLPVVDYRGLRVVTFSMVDDVHNRPDGTASRAFRENRDRFIEGEDFYTVSTDEIRRDKFYTLSVMARGHVTFLTESGYLMLAKSLTDDLAWQVQRELVGSYFRQSQPKTQNEIIAAMALANVEQERRLVSVEEKVEDVAATIQQIKQGSIPTGWAGYSLLRVKCGMTDTKCRTLVKSYSVSTDIITIMTPDGQPRPMKIVLESDFMTTFRTMMSEAEQRGTKWHHPQMGLFQVIGWEAQS